MNFSKMENFQVDEKQEKKDNFLKNNAFKNFAKGFEVYQELLSFSEDKEEIINRMKDLYKKNDKIDEKNIALMEIIDMMDYALTSSENGEFNQEDFADKISSLSIADYFEKQWNLKEGDVDQGMDMLNSTIAIKEEGDNISIHIKPSNTEASSVGNEIKDGFSRLAEKINSGKITCDKIIMKSWLLNEEHQRMAERFLGRGVEVEDVPKDDPSFVSTQSLALQYSSKELKKYLETGNKPKIGKVVYGKGDFVQRFGKKN